MSRIGDIYLMAASPGSARVSKPDRASLDLSAAAYRLLGAVGDSFARIRDAVRTQRLKRQGVRDLLALDDHMLKDIGLERGEIHAVVAGMLSVEEMEVNKVKANGVAKQLDSVTCGPVLSAERVDGGGRSLSGDESAANDERSSIAA